MGATPRAGGGMARRGNKNRSKRSRSCRLAMCVSLFVLLAEFLLKKEGKTDDRVNFLNNLINITPDVKFDVYGLNSVQPIWADHYFKTIANAKMGLNLSRGDAIKYYSSDRITQIIGNGLACLIDERTQYRDFFNDKEMVFYKNLNDLSEKILKISQDEKLRKSIAKNGKDKYMKYFNSNLVAEFIINKTLGVSNKKNFFWEN